MQSVANTTTNTPLLGVSQPVSIAKDTAAELFQTDAMLKELKENNCFETKEETMKRVHILQKLTVTARKWEVAMSRAIPEYKPSAQLLAFGSYRLNVHSPGGDIDTLLVVPRHISRKQFFTSFVEMLKTDRFITKLTPVPDAYVPIITFKFAGVEIDILFANLNMTHIPDKLDLADDRILHNLDEQSIRSINGCRVAERLLKLIPKPQEFCLALRAVKLWAKNHGMSSNAMGFFGGITWAILVARTCQLYPNATAAKIVQKMFMVFSTWQWPCAVILDHLSNHPSVWSPAANRYHLMPVITPAFPQQNSTHNVSSFTAQIIKEEMKAAYETCQKINEKKASWKDLFLKVNFFSRYRHFIAIQINASADKDLVAYTGFFESRIRQLIGNLERNPMVELAHIDTKCYRPKDSTGHNKSIYFIGLNVVGKSLDLTNDIQRFKLALERQSVKAMVPSVELDVNYIKRVNLVQLLNANDLKDGRFLNAPTATVTATGTKRKAVDDSAQPAKKILKDQN